MSRFLARISHTDARKGAQDVTPSFANREEAILRPPQIHTFGVAAVKHEANNSTCPVFGVQYRRRNLLQLARIFCEQYSH